jgi:predicted DNA-binding transcriptional regulator YafY
MTRSHRLLDLLQLLRQHKCPVKGSLLASQLGVSLRTLYRDIRTLQEQGAPIEGEAGLGYILQSGYMLPPLMFSDEEIEALVLGMRWVSKRGDTPLSKAAYNALAKVAAVLPRELRPEIETSTLLIGPSNVIESDKVDLTHVRQAIRKQCKVEMIYYDLKEEKSVRTIWPFGLAFFDHVYILMAWCELRKDFRNFRYDRILSFSLTSTRYLKNRQALLKEWSQREGISLPLF